MDTSKLNPGTHKRKNQKQILAMMRAVAAQAGCAWSDTPSTTGKGTAVASKDGVDQVTVDYAFGTNGAEFTLRPATGEPIEVPALYTDTSVMMAALRGVLGVEAPE